MPEPKIVDRPEQHYLGMRKSVPMGEIGTFMDEAFPAVAGYVQTHGIPRAGAPFARFNVIDMAGKMEIEVGSPVPDGTPGDGQVFAGTVPAGRYASLTYVGPYDKLIDANQALQEWIQERGLRVAMTEEPDGDHFESRIEVYLTDPAEEPDEKKWET